MCRKVEEWRDIPGYDGYQASDWGRIRSFKRVPSEGQRAGLPRIMKPQKQRGGSFLIIRADIDAPRKTTMVSRLVASAWLGTLPDSAVVYHKNGDYTDNSVWNLVVGKNGDTVARYARIEGCANRRAVVKINRGLCVVDAYRSVCQAARENHFKRSTLQAICDLKVKCSVFAPDGFIYTYDDSAHIREAMRRAMTELDALGARYNDPGTERYYDLEPEETPELDSSAQWEDAPPLVGGGYCGY